MLIKRDIPTKSLLDGYRGGCNLRGVSAILEPQRVACEPPVPHTTAISSL